MQRSVEFRATATLAGVRRVAAAVRAWCRARIDDTEACRGVELAVDEACTNIVRHAHPRDPSAVFRVRLGLAPAAVHVIIADRGPRFTGACERASDAAQGAGGLGLELIGLAMHRVAWAHRDGLNVVRMTRRLRPALHPASFRPRDSASCQPPRGW